MQLLEINIFNSKNLILFNGFHHFFNTNFITLKSGIFNIWTIPSHNTRKQYLVDPPEGRDIDGLTPNGSLTSDTGGVLTELMMALTRTY